MVRLGNLDRSADAFESHTAAAPASSSARLPAAGAVESPGVAAEGDGDVKISEEGIRRLQEAAELEAQQAATLEAVNADADLAARLAHEIAYRREIVVVPASAYSARPASMILGGAVPPLNAANIERAQAQLELSRQARIALYEMEKARGTPPAEIYQRLLALEAARPPGYAVVVA